MVQKGRKVSQCPNVLANLLQNFSHDHLSPARKAYFFGFFAKVLEKGEIL